MTQRLPPGAKQPPGATTHVRVIDVGAADAESQVVSESVLHDVGEKSRAARR